MPSIKIPREEYEKIATMVRSGESTGVVGKRFGVSRERIRQIMVHNYPGALETGRSVRKAQAYENAKCPECGGQKSRTAIRCHRCVVPQQIWDRDTIVAAIRKFHEKYGHSPSSVEWNPALARARNKHDVAQRFIDDGCWPATSTVQYHFGSWSKAIAAAGFDPLPVGRPRVLASANVGA